MRARILKIQANPSRKNKDKTAYMIAFKGQDGKSYLTWVDSGFRNYEYWRGVMKVGAVLEGLVVKKDNLIDADSRPVELIQEDKEERGLV